MKLALLLGCAALLGACSKGPSSASPPLLATESRLVESVYLDEWIQLGSGAPRCRVTRAEERLSEPTDLVAGRVPPDLRVLALTSECLSENGQPLSLEGALPSDMLLFLRDFRGTRSAPSVRTKLSMLES